MKRINFLKRIGLGISFIATIPSLASGLLKDDKTVGIIEDVHVGDWCFVKGYPKKGQIYIVMDYNKSSDEFKIQKTRGKMFSLKYRTSTYFWAKREDIITNNKGLPMVE